MVATAVAAVLLASHALAAGPTEILSIEVTAIRAGESGPSDPGLVSFRPRLRRLVGYRAFRIVGHETRPCGWRSETRFALPGDRHLQLLPKSIDNGVVKMQVRLLEGRRRLVDTNIGVSNGGTMMFGVGRDSRVGNEALIILLRAETK